MNKTPPPNKKIVVISGGSGYLGKAIIKLLTKTEFIVVSLEINTGKNNNDSAYHIKADLTDYQKIKETADDIENKFGKIFAIIHTASAPLTRKKTLDSSLKDFNSQIETNVIGGFNLFKSFYPKMTDNGVIIGITSQATDPRMPIIPSGSYIPAKYALRGLLRVLAFECQEKKTRVYGVSPAFMPGGLNNDLPEKLLEFIQKKSRANETTSPEVVARVIVDLINDKIDDASGKSISIPSLIVTDL